MRLFALILLALFSAPLWAAPDLNSSIDKDVAEVCHQFESQKAYEENGKSVMITCELTKQQYLSIINYLKNTNKPVFSNFDDVLKRIGEKDFSTVFRKKDTQDCEPLRDKSALQKTPNATQALSCVMGDMNLTFFLNDKDQILKTKCQVGVGGRIYQNVYDQYFGKFKHTSATLNYNLMVAQLFAKASRWVDGAYVKTEFTDNNFVITFLNPSFNEAK
jgi:hypothetical protein